MESSRRKSRRAEAALLGVTLIWSTTFPLVKFFAAAIDPVMSLFYRFALAGALLGICLKVKGAALGPDWRDGMKLGVSLWLAYILQMAGLRHTTASNSAFLTSLFVMFVPAFEWLFFRRRPGPEKILCVLLAVAGLWLLTGGSRVFNLGDLLTLGTALGWAGYILLVDACARRAQDVLALTFHQFAVVTVLSGLFAMAESLDFAVSDLSTVAVTVYLSLFATLLPLVVQLFAQKDVTPMKTSLIFVLEPVFAAGLSWWLLGETLSAPQAVGAGLILSATVIAELPIGGRKPVVCEAANG